MKKLIKVIGILAVILVVIVVGLLIAAKILITPERVRQVVIPLAEKQLDRPVSIGDIEVRLFSGIVLSDFRIGGKDDQEDFVSAQSLVLRYQLWPLIRRAVIVDEVRLMAPNIRIERYENGAFNFSDLLDKDRSDEDVARTPAESTAESNEAGGGMPIDLLVNEINISGGRLVFIDHMVDREYLLSELMVSAADLSPDQPFPFTVSAKINSAPVSVSGTVNPVSQGVIANVRIQDLDVSSFMAYAPDDFPGKLSSMTLSMEIRADATADAVASDGRISVTDIDFLPDDMPDAHVENGWFHLDYDVHVNLASENIAIAKADADVNGILLALSGSVASYGQSPVLDMRARLPMINLSDIVSAIPPKLAEPIREMHPEGRIGAEVYLKGSPENPESLVEKGDITLENIGVTINDLAPKISGGIRLENDTAASDNLVIQAAGEPLQLRFTANDLMGEIKYIRHTLTAERLDIDRLLAAMGAGEDDRSPAPPADGAPKSPEPGPFDLPLDVKGDVRVANAVFKGLAVDNFDLQYQLKDNVVTVNHIRGNVAGGTITGRAETRLDRTPFSYTANISVQDSRAEHLLNALFPAASNTVYGNFFLNADISGEGISWRNISRSLTSTADVNVTNGRLTGSGLAGSLAGFIGTERLEVINFDSLKGDVQLNEGKFRLDSRLTSDEVRMSPAGMIGLDGSIDLSLDMRLSQSLASDIGGRDLVSALSRTGDGWTLVPVKVAGTLWSPKFEIDASAVTDQLKERGKEEIRQQLQDRVIDRLVPKDRGKTNGQTGEEEKKPLEEELEDTMRNLFN